MTADDFDLNAWITGARLPEKSATVYGRADLAAEYADLEQQLTAAGKATVVDDDRLASSGAPSSQVAARMTEVREEMLSSALRFRFRAISKEERLAITNAAPKDSDGDPDGDYVAAHWLAVAAVRPKLTADQAVALRKHIGEGQFALLWDTAWAVTNDKRVTVPLSLAHSAAVSTQDS